MIIRKSGSGGGGTGITDNNLAETWSNRKWYAGERCLYNGILYRANDTIDEGTEFSEDNWTRCYIDEASYIKYNKESGKLFVLLENGNYLEVASFPANTSFPLPLDPKSKTNFTQAEFIAICNAGLQNKFNIGTIINLNNETCSTFRVIGVDHDNTSGTVDLMPTTQVGNMAFNSSNQYWYSSTIRTWLNSTYIEYFDQDIQNLLVPMSVKTAGTTTSDKVKLLSWRELGLTYDSSYMDTNDGGEQYSVFTAGAFSTAITDRWIPKGTLGNASYYWLRSRNTNNSSNVWKVNSGGTCNPNDYSSVYGVAPALRF